MNERLGSIGKIGCLLSVVGAFIVVLHAPEDKDVTSIDELLFYALQPGMDIEILPLQSVSTKLYVYTRLCYVLYNGAVCEFIHDL